MVTHSPLGVYLKKLREKQALLVREAAAALEVDPSLLSRWESGDRLPTPEHIRNLARGYGVSVQELEAKRIAQKFLNENGDNPALEDALIAIRENAPPYLVNNRRITGQ